MSVSPLQRIAVFAALTGCTGGTKAAAEVDAKPAPEAKAPTREEPAADVKAPTEEEPAAEAKAPNEPLPTLVTRRKGAVDGTFVPEHNRVVAGAPFIVRFSMMNAGDDPMTITMGGDNYAQGPLRFAWLVRNAGGDVVCDLRGRPEPMAGAGALFEKTFEPGELYEAYLAPQTGCPALAQPGRYELRVVRVMVRDKDAESCPAILPPDTTVEPLDDRGVPLPDECKKWLLAAPAIAAEMTIDVLPYDAAAVRKAIDAALAQENELRDHALSSYGMWLCQTVGCEVAWGEPVRDWLPTSAKSLPASWPAPK